MTGGAGGEHLAKLLASIEGRQARVGIIGLGYVGLPLARAFTQGGFPVLGFDSDPGTVPALQRGESYIGHISPATVRQTVWPTCSGGNLAASAARIIDRICSLGVT